MEAGVEHKDEYQQEDAANEQVTICNGKRTNARRCQEHLDRSVFCIYLRARKEWFYTVGTVLGMKPEGRRDAGGDAIGRDVLTIYSSQLGKEKKVLLCSAQEANSMELYKDLKEDDELMLPASWKFGGKGECDLIWEDPVPDPVTGEKKRRLQKLKVFSSVPIVVIPTNTVPIDFAMFAVSPFHKKFKQVDATISDLERKGFDFHEDVEDGVEVVHDADRPSPNRRQPFD